MNQTQNNKSRIPQSFLLRGVSFHKETVEKLNKDSILKMEKDINNEYDSYAIKVLTLEDEMCGFIPKKYTIGIDEFILNKIIFDKFEKLNRKYNLRVKNKLLWDGPTGIEVEFIPK